MVRLWFTLILIFGTFGLQAQDDSDRFKQDLIKRLENPSSLTRIELVEMFWELQVDTLADHINAIEVQAAHQLEESEVDKTIQMSYRYQILDQFHYKNGDARDRVSATGGKVAFLGNSSNPFVPGGYKPEVLGQLLDQIKLQRPQALFFTGNLIWSLVVSSDEQADKAGLVKFPPVHDELGNVVYQASGIYNSDSFRQQLGRFASFVKAHLGEEIPFYPVLGTSEAIGPDSLKIFQEQFPVPGAVVLDSSQLVYNVSLGNADFVVMSLAAFDGGKKMPLQQPFTGPMINWLDQTLKTQAPKHTYLFAVGDEPAFSPEGTFSSYAGEERSSRARFWQLLMRYQVLAYFCSNQAVYDRTYRYGVWQIVSGGAGAENDLDNEMRTLHHFLLLTIPERGAGVPVLQVFDQLGRKRDETAFSHHPPAIFHFRQ